MNRRYLNTGGSSFLANRSRTDRSLSLLVLDLFELGIENIVLRRLGVPLGPAIAAGRTGIGRLLLIHLLQDGARGLLQGRGLLLDVLTVIAAHGRAHRLNGLG